MDVFNKQTVRSLIYLQFVSLGLIIFSGPVIAENQVLLIIELAGILLGLWAIYAMKFENLRISPLPRANFILRKSGPYKIIRHPMYLAIILITIPLVINKFSIFRLVIEILLLFALFIKIYLEEKILTSRVNGYSAYKNQTYRLIPFIY